MYIRFITLVCSSLLIIACSSVKNNKMHEKQVKKLMTIEEFKPIAHMDDSSPVFSGNVDVTMLFGTHDPSNLTGAFVLFKSNARSAWHTHPLGQLLVVTKGEGIVQQWGEKARSIKAGQVVWTPPGVKHWHGACGNKIVGHYALQEKKQTGKNVQWMEKVSDQQYQEALKDIKGDLK